MQITLAKLGQTKLHPNPSGVGGVELAIEDVVVSSLVREKFLSGAANASAVVERSQIFLKLTKGVAEGQRVLSKMLGPQNPSFQTIIQRG